MKWYFSPQLPNQVETEVTQRDQFSNDEVEISETIVREAVQNSLDAAVDDQTQVKVSFRWVDGSGGLDSDFLKKLLEHQLDHAEAAGIDVEAVDLDTPRALVIEDFGTRGLTGSTSTIDEDNFSDFWRRHGKSHKTGKSRGRWGLGKLVYSTSSELGVFFGATVRRSDPDVHIMGQTVLNLRTVGGQKYPPHAFFADIDGRGDIRTEIPVPLKDEGLIADFVQQFGLNRAGKTGLSVVIPYPNREFNVEAMIGVAIVNYFYPLVTGQLVLQLGDTTVDASNVRELAREYAGDSFHDIDALFDFIENAKSAAQGELLTLKPSWADDRKLDENDFEEADLEQIQEQFSSGKLIGLRLPISLKRKDGEARDSSFLVFIQRPEGLSKGLDLYVRGGLTLPGEAKFRERKALGAMIAEEEAVCSFLGDAENAAHTKWVGNAEKLKRNYQNPQLKLQVIRNAVLNLYDLLAEEIEERDERALGQFFWAEEDESGKKGKRRKTPKPPPEIPITPRPRYFDLHEVEGGFTLKTSKEAPVASFPRIVTIQAAYDVVSGNPYKKYSPHDFRMDKKGGITVGLTKQSGSVIEREGNKVKIRVESVPFELQATGFDPNRDIKVKVESEKE